MARKKKVNQKPLEEVLVEGLSHDGRGIARVEGKTVFITNALPGERVLIRYTSVKRRFDEAIVESIIERSSERIDAKCAHFGICGGCSLQHISSENQILRKQQGLLDLLKSIGKSIPGEVLHPLQADLWGYRRKARLGVRYVAKKGRVLVGFREKNGRYLADVQQCEVLDPQVGHQLQALSELIASLESFEQIPQVEVAIGDDATALVFRHLVDLSNSDTEKLIAFGRLHTMQIWSQPKGPDTVHCLLPEGVTHLHYRLNDYDLEFAFRPTAFTQVNASINYKMVSLALKLLDVQKDESVLDLFCGLGNFSLPLAAVSKSVVGVEGDKGLVESAKQNAQHNGMSNTEFYVANLFEDFGDLPWSRRSYDKLLIDPPRSGADEVAKKLALFNPKRIVYVSCDPATLARDTEEIVHRQGYQLSKAGVMDMFPHTSHVESIAVFDKG